MDESHSRAQKLLCATFYHRVKGGRLRQQTRTNYASRGRRLEWHHLLRGNGHHKMRRAANCRACLQFHIIVLALLLDNIQQVNRWQSIIDCSEAVFAFARFRCHGVLEHTVLLCSATPVSRPSTSRSYSARMMARQLAHRVRYRC